MRYIREENIATTSFIYAIVMVLLLTFTTGGLLIAKEFFSLKSDLVTLEQELTREQREQLEEDVSQQVARIDSLRHSMGKRLEHELSNKVSEVQSMATNMYHTLERKLSREEIADTIKEAIRPVRFYEKAGYFFILSMKGDAILYPAIMGIEGKNFLLDDTGTNPDVARNIIRLAKEQKHGFYHYDWVKPGNKDKKLYPKVSYFSYFQQLDWVIATGEYYGNLDEIARKTITKDLESSFAVTNDYFFLYEIHNLDGGDNFATMVVNSNRPELVGKKISDSYADIKGKQFRKEFLKGIREKGEAESIYWYKKPDGSGVGRKMAYFKYYPDWKWVVARGVYLDHLDAVIVAKKEELRTKVKDDIVLLCTIFLVAVVVALIVAYYYAQQLQEIFTSYKCTQQEHLASLEELNKALEIKSNTDVLTRIYNRGYFNQHFSMEIARANRYQSPLSLILFDIDRFKLINDTHGHLTGDIVLQEMAGLVQEQIRKNDLLARWGGEEFTVLVPGVEKEDALLFAEKLRKIIAETRFAGTLMITCSFGVSSYVLPEDGDDLLNRVDKALYKAKENGRNQSVMV
ncbi:sensor domain-containing diguanylate cyclase [Desulforhopalus sp. 52FAK]